jgi:hypothetical protein
MTQQAKQDEQLNQAMQRRAQLVAAVASANDRLTRFQNGHLIDELRAQLDAEHRAAYAALAEFDATYPRYARDAREDIEGRLAEATRKFDAAHAADTAHRRKASGAEALVEGHACRTAREELARVQQELHAHDAHQARHLSAG